MDNQPDLKPRHFFESAAKRKWNHVPPRIARDLDRFYYGLNHPSEPYQLPAYVIAYLEEQKELLDAREERLRAKKVNVPGLPSQPPRIFRVAYQARA
jgi:hypothetical protein